MSLFDFVQDMLPDAWFDNVRADYGDSLTDDVITQSVQEASDFFLIEEPAAVFEDLTIGVYPLDDATVTDDVLIYSHDQLMEMGISEKDGLDLVMTHECAHRALQGLDTGFNSHQEELCCDFFAGVRAGLNGMEVGQFENALADTVECDTHPGGADRVEAIEAGVEYAKAYFDEFGAAPRFSDCMKHFNEIEARGLNGFISNDQITLSEESSVSDQEWYAAHPSFGCTRR